MVTPLRRVRRQEEKEQRKQAKRALDRNAPVDLEPIEGLKVTTKYGGATAIAEIQRLQQLMLLGEYKRVLEIQRGHTPETAPLLFDAIEKSDGGAIVMDEEGEPKVKKKFYSPEFATEMVKFLTAAGHMLVTKVEISKALLEQQGITPLEQTDPVVIEGAAPVIEALIASNLLGTAVNAAIGFQTPTGQQSF